jgi:hypothetical protein
VRNPISGRTPEHADPVLPTVLNGVVDDARKAVLRDLKLGVRGVLDRVRVDYRRCPLLIAMPKEPPITVKPLMVTSRPRTWIAG